MEGWGGFDEILTTLGGLRLGHEVRRRFWYLHSLCTVEATPPPPLLFLLPDTYSTTLGLCSTELVCGL